MVVKLSPDGEHLWSTYVGGIGDEKAYGIAVDANSNILVTGYTQSSGWASGGWDVSYNGGERDAFVVKLATDGGHLWSTYLGGDGDADIGEGISVDEGGNVFATGLTDSSNWVSGGGDTIHGGSFDGFVVKLSTASTVTWVTTFAPSSCFAKRWNWLTRCRKKTPMTFTSSCLAGFARSWLGC